MQPNGGSYFEAAAYYGGTLEPRGVMQDYRKLAVWGRAHALALRVYKETRAFPAAERYSLTAQLRRAAVSIPMNLAEGSGRESRRDFVRFIDIAGGSANETEYQLLLATGLGYLSNEAHAEMSGELRSLRRMLTRLRQALMRKQALLAGDR